MAVGIRHLIIPTLWSGCSVKRRNDTLTGAFLTTRIPQTWSIGDEARYWLQTSDYGFRPTHIGISVRGGEFDSNFFTDGRRRGEALLAGITLGNIHTRYDRYTWNKRFGKYEFLGEHPSTFAASFCPRCSCISVNNSYLCVCYIPN